MVVPGTGSESLDLRRSPSGVLNVEDVDVVEDLLGGLADSAEDDDLLHDYAGTVAVPGLRRLSVGGNFDPLALGDVEFPDVVVIPL